jgi:hypothetical protein
MRFWLGLMMGLLAVDAVQADSGKAPVVIEMYTSKYCPNCPGAEHKLKGVADDNADLLVIFEHVDYWDRDATMKDPYGLADVTQRQYDMASTLGSRPGEVFTPMPVIDGQIMVKPPLMFSWGSALEKGRALPEKPRLDVTKGKDGSLDVVIPAALYGASREVWVLGVNPVETSKVWRVAGVAQAPQKDGKARIAAATLPKGESYVVLLQEAGAGKVVAMGSFGVQK